MADKEGVAEAVDLVKGYAKQELVDPFKGTGRWIGFGLVGSALAIIGLVLLLLAMLRALQEETGSTFTGNWSWVPLTLTLLVVAVLIAIFVNRITKRTL